MHNKTLSRFSQLTGIPVKHLDPVLVDQIYGANRDLTTVYKILHRDQLLRNAAQKSGKSIQDVLTWLES